MRFAAAMSLWALAGCAVAPDPDISKAPRQAAAEFLPKVKAALSGLALDVESYRVRLRRCEGRRGEIREDVFHVWVLLHHARSHADDGAEIVDAAREHWLAKGWKISYYNVLESGGRNLGARDPHGNVYTLRAGFLRAPPSALAGTYDTRCMKSPEGPVPFGDYDPQSR